jgi:hypothetical protein
MQFQQLENIKSEHPSLSPSIDALANYIGSEVDEGRTRIVPALAATYVKRSEAQTIALLMLFEDAGLLNHQFDVVCTRNNAVLLSLPDLSDLQSHLPLHCELCDSEHDGDDLRIELVFEVTPVQVFKQHAVA